MMIVRRLGLHWVLIGLLAWAVVEFLLFSLLADLIGTFAALVFVVGKSAFGLMLLGVLIRRKLARLSGFAMMTIDGRSAAEAMMLVVGAVLIVLPGLLGSLIGAALMLPALRSWLWTRMPGGGRRSPPGVIDLEADQWQAAEPPPSKRLSGLS